jgi:hypothetical protein
MKRQVSKKIINFREAPCGRELQNKKTVTGIVLYLMTVIIRTLVAILFSWMRAPLLPITLSPRV